MSDDVEVPSWVDLDQPFCEARWMRLPGSTFDICLMPRGHDGKCRTFHYDFVEEGTHMHNVWKEPTG